MRLTCRPNRCSHKTNEPAFVMHVAAVVAAARNITIEELDRVTTANALAFFGWPQ